MRVLPILVLKDPYSYLELVADMMSEVREPGEEDTASVLTTSDALVDGKSHESKFFFR